MKQKWWILLTLLLCGCGASSQPDQTGTVQNDRPRLSASTEETAENVAAVEKNENLTLTLNCPHAIIVTPMQVLFLCPIF